MNSFSILEQLQQDEATSSVPILLSSFVVDENGQDLSLEVIDYISTFFEELQIVERVRSVLTLTTGDTQELGTSARKPFSRNGRYHILVVDDNQATVKRLKEALEVSGYKVQRAFNSPQALDVAAAHRPDLLLIDAKMPDIDGAGVISQLSQIGAPDKIPVMLIVDQPVQPFYSNVRLLGRENWAKIKPPYAIDVLVKEIIQAGKKQAQ